MSIQNLINKYVSTNNIQRTNWNVLGLDGASATFGTPGIKLQMGGSIAFLKVQQAGNKPVNIKCFGTDVSVGVTSSSVSVDASIPGIPAIPGVVPAFQSPPMPPPPGITPGVYTNIKNAGSISANSFRGGFVSANLAVSIVPTYNLNFLFMGIPYLVHNLKNFMPNSFQPLLQMFSSCQVMVVATSFSCSVPDASATFTSGNAF